MRLVVAVVAGGLAAGSAPGQVVVRAGFGFAYARGPVFVGPPAPFFGFAPVPVVVVAPPPVVVVQPSAASVIRAMFPPSDDVAELARSPVPRVDPADFRVVRPQNGPAKPPAPAVRPFAPDLVPDPGPVPADPKKAAVFHVAAARTAFAAGQYGRAAERLGEAIVADPADPLAYFLLAQIRTARGEYAEAVAAIRDGLTRAPDWPASGFRLRELYGQAPRAFDAHLGELRQAATDRPGDPTLAFLLGYHLWFLGERTDAAKLFRKALGAVRDGGVIERFLAEADGKDA